MRNLHSDFLRFTLYVFLIILLSACAPSQVRLPLPLASFSESSVDVSIALEQDPSGQFCVRVKRTVCVFVSVYRSTDGHIDYGLASF